MSFIKKKVRFKGKDYEVEVSPDIAVRGGERGRGTMTYIRTDEGVRGYQGPYSENKVKKILKENQEPYSENEVVWIRKVKKILKENPMKKQSLKDAPAVYVGTYGKYNSGSIGGAWLNLEDYADKDDFMEAARELHKDERDPELMFQDYQNFPEEFYDESSLSDKLWDWLELDEDERKVYEAYVEVVGEKYATIDSALENYRGKFDSEGDWAYDFIQELGGIKELGDTAYGYFSLSSLDRRLTVQDLANSYVQGLDEGDLREEAERRGILGSEEKEESDLREEVKADYAEDLEEELWRDPVGYFVDNLGYDLDSLEKIMTFDYDAYARDSEMNGDVSFIEIDHETYAFNPR